MTRIRITWPKGEAIAVLADTPSTRKLLEALPWESSANIWGDEVYFSVPMETEQEADACQMVAPGCFWVSGGLLALPFGPTPASFGHRCHLPSKANILGILEDDPKLLKSVHDGDGIIVQQA
jgi:uncharacterized protein